MRKNRKPYSLAYKLFYRIPISVANVLYHLKPWILDARKNTYYNENPLKSRFSILLDHLYVALKYGQTYKDDYFAMGIDQKGKHISDYIGEAMNTLNLYTINTSRGLPQSKWHYDMCAVLKDKWIFSQMCDSYGLRTPKTYGLIIDGKLISKKLSDFEDLLHNEYDLMFKPVDGACGIGIFHLKNVDGKLIVKDRSVDVDWIREVTSSGKYLIQEFISNQHEGMSKLYNGACNTLRITIVRDDSEKYDVMGAMCMLGAHGTDCSNWHFGGVSVNINKDGTLDKYGYCKIDKKVISHPDSEVVFEGYKIPYFEESVDLAKKATRCFYGFKSIGWDIAITADGPTLIEGNDDWGIVAHQMVENKGWKENWEKHHGKMNI